MGGYTGPNNRRYEQPRRWWHLAILTTALGAVWGWLHIRRSA